MIGLLVFAVLAVPLLLALVWSIRRSGRVRIVGADGRPHLGGSARLVGPILALVLLAALVASSFRVVPVGHGLVIFNTVTKTFRVALQGVTWVVPLVSQTELYDLRRLEYTMSGARGEGRRGDVDDSLWSPTREGLQVGVDITVWHRVDANRVVDVHQRIGPDFEEKIIRPAVRSVIRLVISEYPVMDVYSAKRSSIQDEINVKIKELLEKDGFIIDEVVLRDVRFTEEFAKAIEAKQIAQQAAEQMKYVLEKERQEADRKVIEAAGRAKAIETVNAALRQNPNYIRYLYVDKLSDKVSVIVSDQSTIMDLKGILDSRK